MHEYEGVNRVYLRAAEYVRVWTEQSGCAQSECEGTSAGVNDRWTADEGLGDAPESYPVTPHQQLPHLTGSAHPCMTPDTCPVSQAPPCCAAAGGRYTALGLSVSNRDSAVTEQQQAAAAWEAAEASGAVKGWDWQ